MNEVASLTHIKSKTVSSSVILLITFGKIAEAVLPLLNEKNNQEHHPKDLWQTLS